MKKASHDKLDFFNFVQEAQQMPPDVSAAEMGRDATRELSAIQVINFM